MQPQTISGPSKAFLFFITSIYTFGSLAWSVLIIFVISFGAGLDGFGMRSSEAMYMIFSLVLAILSVWAFLSSYRLLILNRNNFKSLRAGLSIALFVNLIVALPVINLIGLDDIIFFVYRILFLIGFVAFVFIILKNKQSLSLS